MSSTSVIKEVPIYTIGYGAREIDEFISVLQNHDISFLIDVRTKPYSRYKPDFSKQALTEHLEAQGIRYVFMGDSLGGQPEDPNCYSNGKVDYDKVSQRPFFQDGIDRVVAAYQQKLSVVLMCSEGKPEMCHRSKLIGMVLTAVPIPITHIDEKNQLISQENVLLRLNKGQPILFEPEVAPDFEWEDLITEYQAGSIPEMLSSEEAYHPQEMFNPQEMSFLPDPDILQVEKKPQIEYTPPPMTEVSAELKRVFGFDEFRSIQKDIIANVLDKRDSLTIMPTGSGKSLCFQLPALLFPGLTVVISPLISLMQDQVEQLRELGVTAVTLNSSLSYPSYLHNVNQIRRGQVKLLYIAPETLLRSETLALLDQCHVDCLTIDEAHCISEWGHDFRPEYRKLVDVRQRLSAAVCVAVTATATERVREDIKTSLAVANADTFIASFNRENLFLTVAAKTDGLSQTLAFLSSHREQSGIIYCSTRKQVDALTDQLKAHGWPVLPYHAGLDAATRQQNQHQFTHTEVSIIVATIAFGMGINKSNVRFIVHYDLPKNLESYYQQIGRAGRDGLRADCLLLYSYNDVQTINYFISQQAPEQQVGAQIRLKAMLAFVDTNMCRRRPLLAYFGEKYEAETCEACDNCLSEKQELADLTIPAQKFLSCVKRTGEFFGANHIIDVLRGSRSQKILQRGHDRLSTYDIGREFSKSEWQHLARQFIQQELLIQNMEYGSLKLAPKAYDVFKGEQVWGVLPKQPRQAISMQTLAEHDPALFQLLRRKRSELANEAGVPPYVIFSDRSLVDMATYFPQTKSRFGNMYGVGEAKLTKYADIFLSIIQAYCQEKGINEKAQAMVNTPTAPRLITGRKRRMDEVAEAYNDGHSVPEIADDLGVKQSTVLSHLYKYVLTERPLNRSDFLELSQLTMGQQKQVFDLFDELSPERLSPIFEALENRISYDELHILRLHYSTQTE